MFSSSTFAIRRDHQLFFSWVDRTLFYLLSLLLFQFYTCFDSFITKIHESKKTVRLLCDSSSFHLFLEREKCRLRILFVPLKIMLHEQRNTHIRLHECDCVLFIYFENQPTWADVVEKAKSATHADQYSQNNNNMRCFLSMKKTSHKIFTFGVTLPK